MTYSSGSMHFLEQLTELRKTVYLLIYYKRYDSRTAWWKRCVGPGVWEGERSVHAFSEHPLYQNFGEFTGLEALPTQPFWVSMGASLHRPD